jgi:hypothetical protein
MADALKVQYHDGETLVTKTVRLKATVMTETEYRKSHWVEGSEEVEIDVAQLPQAVVREILVRAAEAAARRF